MMSPGEMNASLLSANTVRKPPLSDNQYKDILFLFIFGANLVVILSTALSYGAMAFSNSGSDYIVVQSNGVQMYDTSHDYDILKIVFGILVIISFAGFISSVWIYTLSKFASYIISAVLLSILLTMVLLAIALISTGFVTVGVLLLVTGVVVLVGSLFFRPRIDFAAANLKVACTAITHMPSTVGYALLVLIAHIVFIVMWTIAVTGYATNNYSISQSFNGVRYNLDECITYTYSSAFEVAGQTLTCSAQSCQACICSDTWVSNKTCFTSRLYLPTFFGLLLSLFWTSAVCANVVHCTTASSVAVWWCEANAMHNDQQITKESFVRSCTTSLGSICLGSLLVAVIRTLRTGLHLVAKRMRSLSRSGDSSTSTKVQLYLISVLECILRVLDRAIVYFNRYAFCYVAMRGSDFLTASQSAVELFRARGWTALLNDDIIDLVLNLSNILVGALSMCVGFNYSRWMGLGRAHTTLLSLLGLFGGFLLSMIVMSTISSAVATVYVCFAEDPKSFEEAHPEESSQLTDIWTKMFPSATLTTAGETNGEKEPHSSMGPAETFLSSSDMSVNGADQRTIRGSYRPPLPSSSSLLMASMPVSTDSPVFSSSTHKKLLPNSHSSGGSSYSRVFSFSTENSTEVDRDSQTTIRHRDDFLRIPVDLYLAAVSLLGTTTGTATAPESSGQGGGHRPVATSNQSDIEESISL